MSALRPLPEFDKPPVVELVLDIQFQPLPGLDVPRLGLLWQEFKNEFPRVEQQPRVAPLVERFGPAVSLEPQLLIEPFATLPLPRLWFLDAERSQLIQVQNDRFIHNWRKADGGSPYPRYVSLRERFRQELARFEEFLRREDAGQLVPDLCEISYFNHIEPGSEWSHHGQLHEVFRIWKPDFDPNLRPDGDPEAASLEFRFLIPDEGGKPLGRWRVTVQPGFTRDGELPILVVRNTARGKPIGEGVEGALGFLDVGHDWAVRGFAAMTTEAMHAAWGRTNGN